METARRFAVLMARQLRWDLAAALDVPPERFSIATLCAAEGEVGEGRKGGGGIVLSFNVLPGGAREGERGGDGEEVRAAALGRMVVTQAKEKDSALRQQPLTRRLVHARSLFPSPSSLPSP
jgi:hypothetical protein